MHRTPLLVTLGRVNLLTEGDNKKLYQNDRNFDKPHENSLVRVAYKCLHSLGQNFVFK